MGHGNSKMQGGRKRGKSGKGEKKGRKSHSSVTRILSAQKPRSRQRTARRAAGAEIYLPEDLSWIPRCNVRPRIKETVFEVIRQLGSGVSSVVFEVRYRKDASDRRYALKQLSRSRKFNELMFQTEARILGALRHPGVIGFSTVFVDEENFYTVCELGNIDLFHRVTRSVDNRLPEDECRIIVRKLLETLEYVHSKNLVHRDIKPENIVFTKTDGLDQPKLIDWGDGLMVAKSEVYDELVGTACYLSPERIRGNCSGWELKKSDVWAVGVTLYEMVTGRRCFFADGGRPAVFKKIVAGKWAFPRGLRPSPECQQLIRALLCTDALTRPSAAQALRHPFLREGMSDAEHDATMALAAGGPRPSTSLKNCEPVVLVSSLHTRRDAEEGAGEVGTRRRQRRRLAALPVVRGLAINATDRSSRVRDLIVLDAVANMTAVERVDITSRFQKLDARGLGRVGAADLAKVLSKHSPSLDESDAHAAAQRVVAALDARGAGKSFTRHDVARARVAYQLAQGAESPVVQRVYRDACGRSDALTAPRLARWRVLRPIGLGSDAARRIIAELDGNGDGRVTLEQFAEALKQPTLSDLEF